jgi:hypothetical protein
MLKILTQKVCSLPTKFRNFQNQKKIIDEISSTHSEFHPSLIKPILQHSFFLNNIKNPHQVKFYLEWAIKIFEKNEIKQESEESIEFCLQSLSLIEGQLKKYEECQALINYTEKLLDENPDKNKEHYKRIYIKNYIGMLRYFTNVQEVIKYIQNNILKKDINLFRIEDERLFDYFLSELFFKCLSIMYRGYLNDSYNLMQRITNRFKYFSSKDLFNTTQVGNSYVSAWYHYYQGEWEETIIIFDGILSNQNTDAYMMIESLIMMYDIYNQRSLLKKLLLKIEKWIKTTNTENSFRIAILLLFENYLKNESIFYNENIIFHQKLFASKDRKINSYHLFFFENMYNIFSAIELANNTIDEFNFSKAWKTLSQCIDAMQNHGYYFFAAKLLILLSQKIFIPNRMYAIAEETFQQSAIVGNLYNKFTPDIMENNLFNAYAHFYKGLMLSKKNDFDSAFQNFLEAERCAKRIHEFNPILIHIYSNWIPILNESDSEKASKIIFQHKLKELQNRLGIKKITKPKIML